jgi:hypothetical protein
MRIVRRFVQSGNRNSGPKIPTPGATALHARLFGRAIAHFSIIASRSTNRRGERNGFVWFSPPARIGFVSTGGTGAKWLRLVDWSRGEMASFGWPWNSFPELACGQSSLAGTTQPSSNNEFTADGFVWFGEKSGSFGCGHERRNRVRLVALLTDSRRIGREAVPHRDGIRARFD